MYVLNSNCVKVTANRAIYEVKIVGSMELPERSYYRVHPQVYELYRVVPHTRQQIIAVWNNKPWPVT